MRYFLGIDTGATKSHALIADENGQVCGMGVSGPGNWEVVGWQGTERVLDEIIGQATKQAGVSRAEITGAGFGLAGFDWPEDRQPHEEIIKRVLRPDLPFGLVNDAFVGLWAGTSSGWGVVVGAGTSCNCYGRNPQGDVGRVTGSSRFDENAGSGEFVMAALQAVSREWSRRGPATKLTQAFCERVGATDAGDLFAGLMRERYHIWADAAPMVFAVAEEGDAVALDLVRWAGLELGLLALGVGRQVDILDMAFDVVLAGSFFKGSPLVQQTMQETIQAIAPQANLVRLTVPPVVGAVLLGMEQVGAPTAVARPNLITHIQAYLAEVAD